MSDYSKKIVEQHKMQFERHGSLMKKSYMEKLGETAQIKAWEYCKANGKKAKVNNVIPKNFDQELYEKSGRVTILVKGGKEEYLYGEIPTPKGWLRSEGSIEKGKVINVYYF